MCHIYGSAIVPLSNTIVLKKNNTNYNNSKHRQTTVNK
jgi:hypothetical protein